MRVICQNICYCQGFDGTFKDQLRFWKGFRESKTTAENIAEWVQEQEADIIGFAEIDFGSIRSGFNQQKFFEEYLSIPYSASAVKYPQTKMWSIMPILRRQGNALFSRYPVVEANEHWLGAGVKQLALEMTVKYEGKLLTFILVHLAITKRTRRKQLARLAAIINQIPNEVVLMGDFNTFSGVGELYEFRQETGLNVIVTDEKTFPRAEPATRIDFLMHTQGVVVADHETHQQCFSDHLPLVADITFK